MCTYPTPQRRKRRSILRHDERFGSISSEDEVQDIDAPPNPTNTDVNFVADGSPNHGNMPSTTVALDRVDSISTSRQHVAGDDFASFSLTTGTAAEPTTSTTDVPYNPAHGTDTQANIVPYSATNRLQDATPYPMFTVPMGTPINQSMSLEASSLAEFGYNTDVYDQSLDFPINWLPANDEIDIDYTSILGLGISSMELFPDGVDFSNVLPPPQDVASLSPHSAGSELRVALEGTPYPSSNSGTTPGRSISTTSHHSRSLESGRASPGGLYATSTNGARVPCTVRSRRPAAVIYGAKPLPTVSSDVALRRNTSQNKGRHAFRDLSYLTPSTTELEATKLLKLETYETMIHHFDRICLKHDGVYPSFSQSVFPLKHHMDLFIHLYFEYFNPILPILHNQLFDINKSWQLALAVATIGCQYTQTQDFSEYIPPLHEFLRRVINTETENRAHLSTSLEMVQTCFLGHVGLSYYGISEQVSKARSRQSLLCDLVHSAGLLEPTSVEIIADQDNIRVNDSSDPRISLEHQWKRWVEAETKRRVGYAIWVCILCKYPSLKSFTHKL